MDEDNETVAVSGTTTVATFTVTGTAVNILDDDDAPTVTLVLTPGSIKESDDSDTANVRENRAVVTATLNRASGVATTVTVSVLPNATASAGDYSLSANKELTIAAGSKSSTGTVTITAVDNVLDTADKTVAVKGSATNTLGITAPADKALTLVDDDGIRQINTSASTGVLLSVDNQDVRESASATTITVTAALDGKAHSSATPVVVSVGTGTATAGIDFATVSNFTITIGTGTLSQTVTRPTTTWEGNERWLRDHHGGQLHGDRHRGEYRLHDLRGVLDSKRGHGNVTVTPSRSSGDADVTVSGALTFTPDNWSSAQAVTVSAAEDLDSNNDTAVIGHAVSGGDYGSETARSVTVTVTDDESASTGVLLSVDNQDVWESASATTITVTATLNGGSRSSATPVVVSVGTGTATAGIDFATVNNFTITIRAGTLSQTATFTLAPTDDDVDEDNETVAVSGTTTVPTFTVTGTVVNILDDDDSRRDGIGRGA